MNVRDQQRPMKKTTRENRNDFRKRSHTETNNNINSSKILINKNKNVRNYNNELITNKRLTISLFNKVISSTTVTRIPSTKFDNTDVTEVHHSKTMSSILKSCSNVFQIPFNDIRKSFKHNIVLESPKNKRFFKKNECVKCATNVDDIEMLENVTLFNPSQDGYKEFEDLDPVESYRHHCIFNSSFCHSEIESGHYLYEKFMNDMPTYIREHFPALTREGFINKNIVYFRKAYLNHGHQENDNTCINIWSDINHNQSEVLLNPMDYIKFNPSWDPRVQKKQTIEVSNSSSPSLSPLGSKTDNIFRISPEFQYYPHKLNQ